MARRAHLHPHLSASELSQRPRHVPTLVEARRWQLLALVGLQEEYAGWVIHRYNREGPTSLGAQTSSVA